MPEPILLLIGLAAAGVLVLGPLWRAGEASSTVDDDHEAAVLRHRVALEALRDVEADRRSGSLDDEAYAEQLAEAEARAAATQVALGGAPPATARPAMRSGARATGLVLAAVIGVALL
ncbi:MAG: c-type cytochrome biogenesis protein CcmI, partial [Chloroflexota bacterium]